MVGYAAFSALVSVLGPGFDSGAYFHSKHSGLASMVVQMYRGHVADPPIDTYVEVETIDIDLFTARLLVEEEPSSNRARSNSIEPIML